MKTHADNGTGFTVCGNFDPADEFSETPSCLLCRFFDEIQELWEAYVAQPSNFGEDTHVMRMAEHDAFFTGAVKMLEKTVI